METLHNLLYKKINRNDNISEFYAYKYRILFIII